MYIDVVPNRKSPPAVLLRESFREGKKIRKRTLANLSMLPDHAVEALRQSLRAGMDGEAQLPASFAISQSTPFGHVAAVVGTMQSLGLPQLIDRSPSPRRQRALALIAARLLSPDSKLATATELADDDALAGLSLALRLDPLDSDDLYEAMDYLLDRQERIEKRLAARHLRDGMLVLYDVSGSYYHGHTCPLAKRGHSRDHRRDLVQVVYGVLCDVRGIPLAVKVFEGNTGDPKTLAKAIHAVQERFGLQRVVMVGDRGMITDARIREDLRPAGIDYITALRAPAIRTLVEQGDIQMSLFDQQDLCEISSESYPGERLMACYNPALAEERGRKRADLLVATEKQLQKIVDATQRSRRPLRGVKAISLRVGKVVGRFKMAKHFDLEITEQSFAFQRNQDAIERETTLDGIYVVRTPIRAEELDAEETVAAYKSLAGVERAFRCLKSLDLQVRPIRHRLERRVRAHVFLCMLAYHVQWHMLEALAPLLFKDDDKAGADARRGSIVGPARRSADADAKAARKRNADGDTVRSFRALLNNLSTLSLNRIVPDNPAIPPFHQLTQATAVQQKAFDLLKVQPRL